MLGTGEALNAQGNYQQANGIRIYYESFGSGAPLIFLHGSMGSGRVWAPYVPILSQNYRLIIPDLRGHGKTEHPGGAISLHAMADDVAALIAALDLKKPYLCGWSMGGDLAIDAALRYPDRIGGLIVGGVTHRLPETYSASLQWMGLEGPGLVNFERAQENIPELVAVWQAEHVQSPSHWQDLVTELSYEMVNPTQPAEDELRRIAHPTLIVWGDRDQFLPVENAVDLYRLLPNAQLAVVPNADHFVTRTRVALFAGFVKSFLEARPAGS